MPERDNPESSSIPPGARWVKIETTDQALLTAPVIQFDGAQGMVGNDQIVKFNLYQDRLVAGVGADPDSPLERVICARLVMTPQVLKELATWLSKNVPPEEA